MSKICQHYTEYADQQTNLASEASNCLAETVVKVAEERPKIEAEVTVKQEIGKKYLGEAIFTKNDRANMGFFNQMLVFVTDMLIQSGPTAEPEYKDSFRFLRQIQERQRDLGAISIQSAQFLDLTTTQCQKLYDIGDKFTCHLLRKQPVFDLPPVPHPIKRETIKHDSEKYKYIFQKWMIVKLEKPKHSFISKGTNPTN